MSGVIEVRRGVVRLPAPPLLEAVDAYRQRCGVSSVRALGSDGHKRCWRAKVEGTVSPLVAERLCEVIGVDPRQVYGAAWWDAATRRRTKTRGGRLRDARKPPLDAVLLVEAVEARVRRVTEGLMPLTDRRAAHAEAVRQVFGEDAALLKAYQRGRARGCVTLEAAELLCDAFGWHPYQIWGDAYDAAAFAGKPADFNPWEGVA